MKKTFLIILLISSLLFIDNSQAQPDWFWQNPLPQGNYLNDVKFINTTTGWAVGNAGTILRTTNGGTNWTSQTSGTTNDLYAVSFTDANNGTLLVVWYNFQNHK